MINGIFELNVTAVMRTIPLRKSDFKGLIIVFFFFFPELETNEKWLVSSVNRAHNWTAVFYTVKRLLTGNINNEMNNIPSFPVRASAIYVGLYFMSTKVKCFFPLLGLHSQVEASAFEWSKPVFINYKQKTKAVYNLSISFSLQVT